MTSIVGSNSSFGSAAVSGSTTIAAVVGNPVRHSKSPILHNAGLHHLGLDWMYGAFEVEVDRGDQIVDAMRVLGLGGLSVTMPFKRAVATSADEVSPVVERLGVANTLYWRDGAIVADSTDGDGFVAAYHHRFQPPIEGASVAVVGAGGAARSIIEALGRAGAERIAVINRTASSANEAAELAEVAYVADVGVIADCQLVVNATSVGMAGGPAVEDSPVPSDLISPDHKVMDIVYQPAETVLMAAAAERGAEVENGLGMLIHQAALQFERFTGHRAPVDVMRQAVS